MLAPYLFCDHDTAVYLDYSMMITPALSILLKTSLVHQGIYLWFYLNIRIDFSTSGETVTEILMGL